MLVLTFFLFFPPIFLHLYVLFWSLCFSALFLELSDLRIGSVKSFASAFILDIQNTLQMHICRRAVVLANRASLFPLLLISPLSISPLKDVSHFLRSPSERDGREGNVLAGCGPSINVNARVLLFIRSLFLSVPPYHPPFPHLASSRRLSGNPSAAFISFSLYFSRTQFSSTPADIHHAPLMWQFSKVIFNYASMSSVIRAETLPLTVCLRPELCERVCDCLCCVSERKLKGVYSWQIESVFVCVRIYICLCCGVVRKLLKAASH